MQKKLHRSRSFPTNQCQNRAVLTDGATYPHWPLVGWSVAAEKVNGHSRQGYGDADQGVDGVTVEGYHHQEDCQEAEDDGVDEAELEEEEKTKREAITSGSSGLLENTF